MIRKKGILSIILASTILLSTGKGIFALDQKVTTSSNKDNNELRLLYNSPAEDSYNGWEKWSLPIGNGHMGASVFGGLQNERVQLNEKTLWSGGPSASRPDYNGGNIEANATVKVNGVDVPIMKAIQDAFARGDTATANSLCNKLTGVSDDQGTKGYGYYLSYGNMYLDFKDIINGSDVKNYTRDLDLNTAVSSVNYNYKNVDYTREYFISYSDNVIVTRLSASESSKLSLDVRIEPDNTKGDGPNTNNGYTRKFTKTAKDGLITIAGELDDNQMKFNSQTKVINTGGTITDSADGKVNVKEADEVIIITSIVTDYKNDYPKYRTGESTDELSNRVNKTIVEATKKGFDGLLESHLADYQGIFSRVDLDLMQTPSSLTTDNLLKKYNDGSLSQLEQRYLEVLLFQYGRYLTIASSRDGSLPSNLQGIWTGANNSPWHSDYHMNVNLQMNYWPVYSTNMTETALPLIDYVESLREPGRVTAGIYANIKSIAENPENGFMAHTQNTPFGWTTPGWSFDWGWSPAAVPWILQNVWEYYEYTGDLEFMKNNIYPMLKEEAVLYEQMLIEDPETGKLVCSPAYSPEHGPRTNGNTYEQALIWQMYEDVITAAKLVGEDSKKIEKWQWIQDNLKGPIEIGDSGQIKEWYEETTLGSLGSKGHRHLSHLLGLFPGDLISVETPELLEAAIVSLNDRGDQSTGWAMGQRINTWARTGDGNRAYTLIRTLFKSGILTNLWDTHSPFQIDGNFGMTSGVAEMLMQSNMGYINLMAAIPDSWSNGSVSGLLARGNFEVGMEWKNKQASKFTIESNNGGECILKYENIELSTIIDSKGNRVNYKVLEDEKISFDTTKGEVYTITNIPTSKAEAPSNLNAYRIDNQTVDLEWNSIEGKDVVYNVYRQIENGDLLKVAENISDKKFTDKNAQDILGVFKYSISAVINGEETKLSNAVEVKDLRNKLGYIDDQDQLITYTGAWGNWSEAVNYAGTIKYLQTPIGNETAELTFVGTGIEVIVVTNSDRGKYEVFIDGISKGEIDTYSPSTVRKKVVYSNYDLPKGKHTIKLRATATKSASASGAKVELDAFNVIDKTSSILTGIDVTSKSGIYTVGKANSKLQMVANVTPKELSNSKLNWKVTDSLGNATNLATVDENGLLTTSSSNGTIKITATSKDNESINDSVDVKIAIPSNSVETVVEDAIKNNNIWTKNSAFTWNGNWLTWDGEPTKHHGTTKTETVATAQAVGSSIEYAFKGTGIEVYAHKHTNFAGFDISIDGGQIVNYSLEGNNEAEALVASIKNLQDGNHTIKLVVKERAEKYQVNIDYFKVLSKEGSSPLDKGKLQTSIETNSNKLEKDYTVETWKSFKEAYAKAIDTMNNDNSTNEDIILQTKLLNDASVALVEKSVTTPPDVSSSKVEAIGVESTTFMLRWTSVQDAVSYNIYKVNNSTSKEELLSNTQNLYYRINNLTANTEYSFIVKAVSENSIEASLPTIKVKTNIAVDNERPSDVNNLKVSKNKIPTSIISWDKSTDDKGVIGYKIYVNGAYLGLTVNTSYELNDLEYGKSYSVKVVAVDAAGNTSLTPAFELINEIEKDIEVDKTVLKKAIEDAEALNKEEYTEESWNKVSNTLDEAKVIFNKEDITQEDVNNIKDLLNKAIEELEKVDIKEEVDKIVLKKAIEDAEILNKEEYTQESWDILAKALEDTKVFLNKNDVCQEDVNTSVALLNKAIKELKKVEKENNNEEKPVVADKEQLNKLIDSASKLNKEEYTKESWGNFEKVLEESKVIFNKKDSKQEEVDNLIIKLDKAIKGLKKNEIIKESNSKETDNKNNNNTKINSNEGDKAKVNGLPLTGDISSLSVGVLATVVTFIGLIIFRRKNI